MSAISDYAAKQAEHNKVIEDGLDGIAGDIAGLNEAIAKLQASQGTLSAEDQALLDEADAKGKAIADRVSALDAQTPPAPPAP